MNVPPLPTEIWTMIFERFDFPALPSVIRRNRSTRVRDATLAYEAGQPQGIANLPEFERSKWLLMRQYYHISQSLREAATLAKISGKWCKSFRDVIRPAYLEPPRVLKTHSKYDPATPPQPFHGSHAPEYLAMHLYNEIFLEGYRVETPPQHLEKDDKVVFWGFPAGHPAFATLRRIDFIIFISDRRHSHAGARKQVFEMMCNVEEEWYRRGVSDGVVRIFWEFVDEMWEDDSKELERVQMLWYRETCEQLD